MAWRGQKVTREQRNLLSVEFWVNSQVRKEPDRSGRFPIIPVGRDLAFPFGERQAGQRLWLQIFQAARTSADFLDSMIRTAEDHAPEALIRVAYASKRTGLD